MNHHDPGRHPRPSKASRRRANGLAPVRDGLEIVHSGELGWTSPDGRTTSAAMLVDLADEGLIVLADGPAPEPGAACFRLTWPLTTPWMPVTVLECRATRIGPVQVRLAPRRRADVAALATLAGLDPSRN